MKTMDINDLAIREGMQFIGFESDTGTQYIVKKEERYLVLKYSGIDYASPVYANASCSKAISKAMSLALTEDIISESCSVVYGKNLAMNLFFMNSITELDFITIREIADKLVGGIE